MYGATPISIEGGNAITIQQANTVQDGYLSKIDFQNFDAKQRFMYAVPPISIAGGNTITIQQANQDQAGYLSSVDFNSFNNKISNITASAITFNGTIPSIAITNGNNIALDISYVTATRDGILSKSDYMAFGTKQNTITVSSPLLKTGSNLTIQQSTTATDGYLSSGNFNIFNNKVSSITTPTNINGMPDPSAIFIDNTDAKNPIISFRCVSPLVVSRTDGLTFNFNTINTWGGRNFFNDWVYIQNTTGDELKILNLSNALSGYMVFWGGGTNGSKTLMYLTPSQFYSNYPPPGNLLSSANIWTNTNTFNGSTTFNGFNNTFNEYADFQSTAAFRSDTTFSNGVVNFLGINIFSAGRTSITGISGGTNTANALILSLPDWRTNINDWANGYMIVQNAGNKCFYYKFSDFATTLYANNPPPAGSIPGNVARKDSDNAFSVLQTFNGGMNIYTYDQHFGPAYFYNLIYCSNRIGVGTSGPSYPVHVESYTNTNLYNYGYLYQGGAGGYATGGNVNIAVYSPHRMACSEFMAFSDTRIKKDIVDVVDGDALNILRQIEPKMYKYKDTLKKGDKPVYGYIAQQIKEVLPHAVGLIKEFIPSIMCKATLLNKNTLKLEGRTDDLATDTHLKVFIDLEDTTKVLIIDRVLDETTILIKDIEEKWIDETKEVFIYGHMVDDFHSLNKEAINTIAVSAVQEIDRTVEI
jgi:hypothetical protein